MRKSGLLSLLTKRIARALLDPAQDRALLLLLLVQLLPFLFALALYGAQTIQRWRHRSAGGGSDLVEPHVSSTLVLGAGAIFFGNLLGAVEDDAPEERLASVMMLAMSWEDVVIHFYLRLETADKKLRSLVTWLLLLKVTVLIILTRTDQLHTRESALTKLDSLFMYAAGSLMALVSFMPFYCQRPEPYMLKGRGGENTMTLPVKETKWEESSTSQVNSEKDQSTAT
ncbi:hypothetical protein PWT90_00229 [Aphanocladium album]|nr:hypothetical protein PWT90_00229 [Aphanocladium album]